MSEIWWDVVGVGENSVDHVLRLPALPSLADATKLEIRSSTHEPGGQVVTTLCTCIAMDVVRRIGTTPTGRQDRPVKDVVINSIKITRT